MGKGEKVEGTAGLRDTQPTSPESALQRWASALEDVFSPILQGLWEKLGPRLAADPGVGEGMGAKNLGVAPSFPSI